jgi:hypothetical protein
MLFDLDAVVQHLTDDSEAETIPWSFNADAAEFVMYDPRNSIFGQPITREAAEAPAAGIPFEPPRGTTRMWADMTDSDDEPEPAQETAAQRNTRRLEELRHSSVQDIVVLDGYTYRR